ncbi:MAG: RidA family protein [Armatimonadota bacterium]
MKNIISTDTAPAAIGPYSQAVEVNGTIYTSGQIPLDPISGEMVGTTATEQVRQVLTNLQAVLKAAGVGLDHVVKTTIFLTNLAEFANVNAVYAEFFPSNPPARSTVQVAALPKGALVEIEAIAVK